MTFDIGVNGRSRMVSVERAAASRYRVVVDGRPHEIDVARVETFGLSLLLDGDGGGRVSREVQVAPAGPVGLMLVRIEGRTVTATVNGRRTGRTAADVSTGAGGPQAVLAPMPGRVVRVLVAVGDAVTARQAVVVVEAMKMENELRSPKDGRVKEVAVAAGASVEAGRILVVIE
jgi:biotin carboxyl carrier protein